MIEIDNTTLAGIDVLHATPAGQGDAPLPVIIFWHGFTSSKTVYSYFAVALAQAGFRVIMPDAPEHGARFDGDEATRLGHFWQILHGSVSEYPALRDALTARGWIADGRLGIGGASMGAMTALAVATYCPQVRCVASLMGSGYFTSLARTLFPPLPDGSANNVAFEQVIEPLRPYDAASHLAALAARPLFLWHGADDDVVPATESSRLQQSLAQQGLDTQLTWCQEPGVKHRITPLALTSACTFFTAHL